MKKIIIFLVLLSNFVCGQNLPVVVDNSKLFPPVGNQAFNSCHTYSMVYYLKSYLWNRKFNRDPKLLENQFNPYFVWNLGVNPGLDPGDHWMESEGTYNLMKNQGCATIADFPMPIVNPEIMPNVVIKEKALSHKSKNLAIKKLDVHTVAEGRQHLKELKDSLNKGACFTIHFLLYNSIDKLRDAKDSVYNYENNLLSDIIGSHVAAVVGYNDTIKTKSGRGALKVINSWGTSFGSKGYFYLDYGWFDMSMWSGTCYFLTENFDYTVPDLYLALNLFQTITGDDKMFQRYLFVDEVESYLSKNFDFINYNDYLRGRNLVRVKSINNKNINSANGIININNHDHDGSHNIVADLTDYIQTKDFQSLEVIVNDPVSAAYIDENNQTLYSYAREAKAQVYSSFIKLIGTDKYIFGKVSNLPDTTIILKDFYSKLVGFHMNPQVWSDIFVKSCTSTIKRKLITFSISDQKTLTSPVWTKIQTSDVKVAQDSFVSLQFEAKDSENSPITYSIIGGVDASIDENTGLFTYKPNKIGNFIFKIQASNPAYSINTTFKIVSHAPVNNPPYFTNVPSNSELLGYQLTGTKVFKFTAIDPEGEVPFFNLIKDDYGFGRMENDGTFYYFTNEIGTFPFEITVFDGSNVVSLKFTVKIVAPNSPPKFVSPPLSALQVYTNKSLVYPFKAEDPNGDVLTFSILEANFPGTITADGVLTFQSAIVGLYNFTVIVYDGIFQVPFKAVINAELDTPVNEIDFSGNSFNVFPNPLGNNTYIEVLLSKRELINISVYDALGRRLSVITNQEYEPGKQIIDYDASNLKSGTYIFRLNSSSFSKSLKILKQ